MDEKLLETLRTAFREVRDAGVAVAGGVHLTSRETLDAADALRFAADALERAFLDCHCGRGPIVGGPVAVCLECELGPYGLAWEDEMRDRMEHPAF